MRHRRPLGDQRHRHRGQPTWVDYTGGDTLLSVAVTGAAVYVGGHKRWQNNPYGRDQAGAGAVPRPGIAALDPANGMPFSWNPGRNPRGAGAYAVYATPTGLWVGSDTDWIGNFPYKRGKMAFFPLAGGTAIRAQLHRPAAQQRDHRFADRRAPTSALARPYDGTTAGAEHHAAEQRAGLEHRPRRGHGRRQGVLRLATDSNLYCRTFDGSAFGPANLIDPYKDPAWSTVDTGSGQTYLGKKSGLLRRDPERDVDVLLRRPALLHDLRARRRCSTGTSPRRAGSSAPTASRSPARPTGATPGARSWTARTST